MLSNPGPLEVVRLDAPLGGGPLREQALEHPDHAVVLADLDPEFHRLAFGIPAGVLGKVKNMGAPVSITNVLYTFGVGVGNGNRRLPQLAVCG
jgi:hypothetical protein